MSTIEAMPSDIIRRSDGKALVAVGIPVDPVEYTGTTFAIGRINNALVFPGLRLGVIVSKHPKSRHTCCRQPLRSLPSRSTPRGRE
jgi:malic enzyme